MLAVRCPTLTGTVAVCAPTCANVGRVGGFVGPTIVVVPSSNSGVSVSDADLSAAVVVLGIFDGVRVGCTVENVFVDIVDLLTAAAWTVDHAFDTVIEPGVGDVDSTAAAVAAATTDSLDSPSVHEYHENEQ